VSLGQTLKPRFAKLTIKVCNKSDEHAFFLASVIELTYHPAPAAEISVEDTKP
jgi:hypothetical protein